VDEKEFEGKDKVKAKGANEPKNDINKKVEMISTHEEDEGQHP
jgi:hypothetical protein